MMDTNNMMSHSQDISASPCTRVVSQDIYHDDNFYDAVRDSFLQQSAIFLSAECGYLAELE